jgi:eukaryotic-like serine/threonine-protein kinase
VTDLPQTSTIIDGRYRVLSRVGSGGMADVVCAEDLQLGRKVAIKLLHRRFAEDAEFVERFRREASSAAGLQHPNVVSVYDRGSWDGTYYIAMEYLDGRSLKRVVLEEAPLEPSRAIDLTVQILRAARFAHRRGIIHRDLKPHNVIVDAEGRAKVTDFGIARAGASDMTQTGSIMGTAQYLSPEQAQGHAVTPASDLYSVGIILYEMLTGRLPFEGESAVSIALKQVNEQPAPPRTFNPNIAPELEAVVLRALAKDPARRFGDADEMIAALEAAAAGIAPAPLPFPPTGEATQVLAPGTGGFVPIPPPAPYQDVARVQEPPGPLPPPAEDGARRWWIALLVGLLVAGAIVGGLLLFGKEKVSVPNVVGAPQADAQIALKRKGFSTDVTLKESPTKPKGEVIGQDPAGGSRVAKGSVITLTVSAGPGTARIPDLAGQPRSKAEKNLDDLGFKVVEERQNSDTIGENRVIETRPAAGQELEKGQDVTVVVSSGKERVAVPSVKGFTTDDARSALDDAGFKTAVKEQESQDQDPGTVLDQDPQPGTTVAKGSTVTITVAKAPPDKAVPDLTGRTERFATRVLHQAGFEVATQSQDVGDPAQDGKVIDQSPAPGDKAKKGSTVTITLGHLTSTAPPAPGSGGTTTPAPTPTPTTPAVPAP